MMAESRSYLVVGLGNPGSRYAQSRHNIGFRAVDHLAAKHGCSFSVRSSFLGEWCAYGLGEKRIILLKPHTFMNLSGRSVVRVVEEERLPADHLIVIHDDLDLEAGKVKIVFNRGDGGQKGVRSIMEEMSERGFLRIKCGIGRPPTGEPVVDYVLHPPTIAERGFDSEVLEKIEQAVTLIVLRGKTGAMNEINRGD